jgi:hypothetical protein
MKKSILLRCLWLVIHICLVLWWLSPVSVGFPLEDIIFPVLECLLNDVTFE